MKKIITTIALILTTSVFLAACAPDGTQNPCRRASSHLLGTGIMTHTSTTAGQLVINDSGCDFCYENHWSLPPGQSCSCTCHEAPASEGAMELPKPCGFCERVRRNRGGNPGYGCRKHTRSVQIRSVRLFRKEDMEQAHTLGVTEGREKERERILSLPRLEIESVKSNTYPLSNVIARNQLRRKLIDDIEAATPPQEGK